MNTRLTEIKKAFKKNGITLKEELDYSKKFDMKDSVTNQFMKIKDIDGKQYLIRVNGKLWPPFTREGEDYNLKKLKINRIGTTVIVNNMKLGFQICQLNDDKTRFNEMLTDDEKEKALKKISIGIKKFHQLDNFKNNYPIASTINSSLKRLPEKKHKELDSYYKTVLSMLSTLHADGKNWVPSHNDLLPSSVYLDKVDKNQISFVDWEYSAENHRSYDLSLFSIKSSLTPQQEQKLVTTYDPSGNLNMQYSVAMMKPIVNFLLLLWNLSSTQSNAITAKNLLHSLTISIQDVIYKKFERSLLSETRFTLFSNKENIESMPDKKFSLKYFTI